MRKQSSYKSAEKQKKLTKDEVENFQRALKDSDFLKLMAEHVTKISDKKNRDEQNEYIQQLEIKTKSLWVRRLGDATPVTDLN